MTTTVRNRLLALGALWGVLLAAVPALAMTRPYRLTGFLVAAILSAALSGCVGVALESPVELSTLMSPRIFLGSFFVALSVFLYSAASGLLLGPAFGTLVNRTVKEGRP